MRIGYNIKIIVDANRGGKPHSLNRMFNLYPANTKGCFDVDSTSFERYGCQMDAGTTLCAYWQDTMRICTTFVI